MSLRDQPYLPLYIQDFQTDEKLMECSAAATGVYIRIMCVLHKTNDYGKILLRQKDKQKEQQINNFALKFAKFLPYDFYTVLAALEELVEADVLKIDGDAMYQKRMVNDAEISLKRSLSGSLGGKATKHIRESATDFATANNQANAEYENDIDNVIKNKEISNGTWEMEKRLFLNAEQWIYKNCTAYGITKVQYIERMNEFLILIEKKEDFKSEKELKKHFISWYEKNKNKPVSSNPHQDSIEEARRNFKPIIE